MPTRTTIALVILQQVLLSSIADAVARNIYIVDYSDVCDPIRKLIFTCGSEEARDLTQAIKDASIPPKGVYFDDVRQIEFVGCEFERLPDRLLTRFSSLHKLSINAQLTTFTYIDLPDKPFEFRSLDLSSNRLQKLDHLLFPAIPFLAELDLSHNQLQAVPNLSYASELVALRLAGNPHAPIHRDTFSRLAKLKTLDLSSMQLTSAAVLVDRAAELTELNLSGNRIGRLQFGDFRHHGQLKALNLSSCILRHIEPGTFSVLAELVRLDLSDNRLTSVDLSMFVPSLESLRLNGNQLTELDEHLPALVPHLAELVITANQFNCSYVKHVVTTLRPHVLKANRDVEARPNVRGISCKEFRATGATSGDVAVQEHMTGHERGFYNAYDLAVLIALLFVGLTNLAMCTVIIRRTSKSNSV